jgi:hypothetical protein
MAWPFRKRVTEASLDQLTISGAAGGQYAVDPIDGDQGYRRAGSGDRETPSWTLEKQRAYSVAGYRLNPMARAIVDTYTSFVIGDSGLSIQCTNDEVRKVVMEFWNDPRNRLGDLQDLYLRDHMLMGESALEMMVGPLSGITRVSPIATSCVAEVHLFGGNPLWPSALVISQQGVDDREMSVAGINDMTGLREGEVQWWPSWKTTLQDRRGQPFLGPILDWLDDFDNVLSNLVDRTALARHLVYDVTLEDAGPTQVADFIKQRGGVHIPKSGTIEVHNQHVKWDAITPQTGAVEDTQTSGALLGNIAAGAGLAKHWLADPDNANRATALTMAEPVLRRVSGVQNLWISYMSELVRYAVDQAVAKGRLPATVPAVDAKTAAEKEVPAAQTVQITGPEIAVQEQQSTADSLLKLAQGLDVMIVNGILTPAAAKVLTKKAWEQYAGVPYTADLDSPSANPDDIAQAIADAGTPGAIASGKATLRKIVLN